MDCSVDDQLVRSVPYAEDPMVKDIFSKAQYIQLSLAMDGACWGHVAEDLSGPKFVINDVSYSQSKSKSRQ